MASSGEMVALRVITEEEFWAIAYRKEELDLDTNRWSKQQAELKNAMISDIKPLINGKANKATLNLILEIIHQHWTSTRELLKQFWSSYPITVPYLDTEVKKLIDAMTQIHQKLEEIKESVHPDLRYEVSLCVQPLVQALDAAFEHCRTESQKWAVDKGDIEIESEEEQV